MKPPGTSVRLTETLPYALPPRLQHKTLLKMQLRRRRVKAMNTTQSANIVSDWEPMRLDTLNTGFVTGMFCFNNIVGGAGPNALISDEIGALTPDISSTSEEMRGSRSGHDTPHPPLSSGRSSPHFFADLFDDYDDNFETTIRRGQSDAMDSSHHQAHDTMSDGSMSRRVTTGTSRKAIAAFPFLELLENHIGPAALFTLFSIDQLLDIRQVCQRLRDLVDEYMLQKILPRSHMLFSTTFIDDGGECTETEILYP